MKCDLQRVYRKTLPEARERVVVNVPADEAKAIDNWAVPAGMPNRSAAIRHLLRKGLEAVTAPAAEQASRA